MDGDHPEQVVAHPRVDRRRYRGHRLNLLGGDAGGEDCHVTAAADLGDHNSVRIGAFGGSLTGHQFVWVRP